MNNIRNVDDMRTKNNPKKVYEGRPLAPPTEAVKQRVGDIGSLSVNERRPIGSQRFGAGAPATA